MNKGYFYYISDQYFIDFPDTYLMQNKETINGNPHGRPCFYALEDSNTGLFWMIPISSQVAKYRNYYNKKIKKYNRCDTITFGQVLGHEKAFLIQNMCPITPNYIQNEYIDIKSSIPVRINKTLEQEIIEKAKHVLALHRYGTKLIFPDVLNIEKRLLNL